MILNVELKTSINITKLSQLITLQNMIEAFVEVINEDFPDCKAWKIDLYDEKSVIKKQFSDVVPN